jgi:two-component system LytT family response regulator
MKNVLKTIIVDDEVLARRGLRHRLADIPDLDIIAEARNGREALELIEEFNPDLVFLDIQMPGMDGFDVLRALPDDAMPAIVFVTAFDDYAIKAFEANALDYLLKPIEDDRLAEALNRVRQTHAEKRAVEHKASLLRLLGQITGQPVRNMKELTARGVDRIKKKDKPRLAIRDGGRTIWVPQQDIEWIDAAGDYMCVHARGETHIMRTTMKKLESELDPEILQRIHRSTIVNIHKVTEMRAHINGEYFLTLEGGHRIKLSRSYKDKLSHFS